MDEGAYPSQMILATALPLLFGATMGWIPPKEIQKIDHAITESSLCSCVAYVRQWRPDIPLMDADRFVPATTTPSLGAVAVMVYPSGVHHVAYVADVRNGQVLLYHANVEPCKERIEWRDVTDWRLRGYR